MMLEQLSTLIYCGHKESSTGRWCPPRAHNLSAENIKDLGPDSRGLNPYELCDLSRVI